MASDSSNSRIRNLEAENRRLFAENQSLRSQLARKTAKSPRHAQPQERHLLRNIGVILSLSFAVALLVVGNIFFWAGNTVVNTDRYVASTAPLIKNSEIQKAIANKTTQAVFSSVDVEQEVADVLPPRADFLAPTISGQIRQNADTAIKKILQRPQFQERWNNAQRRSHDRFITAIKKHGSDGTINISEVYSDASQQLQGTKLSFLAGKPLPDKVGQIKIVSGGWIAALGKMINNIGTWRTLSLLLLVIFSALGVWLSRNRRRAVITLGILFALGMFLTAVSARLAREIIAGKADPQYAEAVRQAYTIILHPLAIQTYTIMAAGILIALVTWVSAPYRSSRAVRTKIDQLFSGRIHQAIFSHENSFTTWMGAHKNLLQWLVVAVVAAATLLVRLTPAMLLTQILIIVVAILLIEILAAKTAGYAQ